jgi:hypothetical protein
MIRPLAEAKIGPPYHHFYPIYLHFVQQKTRFVNLISFARHRGDVSGFSLFVSDDAQPGRRVSPDFLTPFRGC